MPAKEIETLSRVPGSLESAPYDRRGLGPAVFPRRVVHV
jgi:hypothetical protein